MSEIRLKARVSDGRIEVLTPYALRNAVRAVPGATWDRKTREWTYPATPAAATNIYSALRSFNLTHDEQFGDLMAQARAVREVPKNPDTLRAVGELLPVLGESRPHQIRAFLLMAAVFGDLRPPKNGLGGGFYLAHDMGTGKTKTVIDYVENFNMARVLIVCPRAVIPNWQAQWRLWAPNSKRSPELLRTGTVKTRSERMRSRLRLPPVVFVVNYEAVWRKPMADVVLDTDWDLVVADEIHRIKSHKGRTSKFFEKLRAHARRRLGLSGTPMPNNPLDLFAQMRFLDPGLFGSNFYQFRAKYAIMGGFESRQVVAFRNIEHLNETFYRLAHRVTKDQVLDLPEVQHQPFYVGLEEKALNAYQELEDNFVARLAEGEITVGNALVELLKLQQVVNGFVFDDEHKIIALGNEKAEALQTILEDLPPQEPVVVFGVFDHDLAVVHQVAELCGRGSAELSGKTDTLAEWQRGHNGITVLAANLKAGGLGIDLTRAAYCVYYAAGFSLGDYEQSLARTHRQGQKRNVIYMHLIVKGTVDEKVYRALESKAKVVEAILETWS